MDGLIPDRRAGCKRARTGAGAISMTALLALFLAGPLVPTAEALKLASISEERGHLGVGLLRAVEVVRGRYERAWALVSASEPSAEDLETALELLQVRLVVVRRACAYTSRCVSFFLEFAVVLQTGT